MLPPHQGLETDDGAGGEIDDRLVVDDKPQVAAHRPAQVRFELEPFHNGRVHVVAELFEAVLPVFLRPGRRRAVRIRSASATMPECPSR
jgi:hypothetical protein